MLADFGSRARQNARLFTLARSLRAQAEERERERARLSDRLLTAEEEERRRLSLALHDGPQQTIAGVGLMLEAALSDLGDEEHQETTRVIRLAMDRTRGIVRDLRRLTFALEPITLRDHGFSAAFGELAGQTADAHRIDVDVDAEIVDALERPIQVCLYRIAQEALANTVKHARRAPRLGASAPPARRQRRVRDRGRRERARRPSSSTAAGTTRASTRCASAPPASARPCASSRRPAAAPPCA